MFSLNITTHERKKDKIVCYINRIASEINVAKDFPKGLADMWKNRAKDSVRYSKDNSEKETDSISPALYLLLKFHTQWETIDEKLWYMISTGSIGELPNSYKELDHGRPGKVKEKDSKCNSHCQRDSVEADQNWYNELKIVCVTMYKLRDKWNLAIQSLNMLRRKKTMTVLQKYLIFM